jgi:hypothetical protein
MVAMAFLALGMVPGPVSLKSGVVIQTNVARGNGHWPAVIGNALGGPPKPVRSHYSFPQRLSERPSVVANRLAVSSRLNYAGFFVRPFYDMPVESRWVLDLHDTRVTL